jgi:hypothetical protein
MSAYRSESIVGTAAIIAIVLVVAGLCLYTPEPKQRWSYTKTVIAKEAPIESELNVWATATRNGIHTQSVTVHYLIYDDGSKEKVSVEQWAITKIGDTKEAEQ